MRILDLFCCAGGASVGYSRAFPGAEIIGVDIVDQPRYPFLFDRLDVMQLLPVLPAIAHRFDFIHASPPCQHYSTLAARNGNADDWPDLVGTVREHLELVGLPYVIENVEGAPLVNPVMLCGTMFPGLRVLRHRLFEANFPIVAPPHTLPHPLVFTHDKRKRHFGRLDQDTSFVQVTGGGNATVANKADAMGIDWMNGHELNEAIPPSYTEWVGRALSDHLALQAAA